MVTKDQAINARLGQIFHLGICTVSYGPRQGKKESVTRIRVSGSCQTWKTRPNEFRLPVKFGLYESGSISHDNATEFHAESECPAGIHY